MTLAREEVFGPVLNVMRMDDLDDAIELANSSAFGNGAAIFTNSGKAAREFKHRVKAGMVGINVGVPATMAMFPFTGWDESFFGDLHIQGREGVQFYTQQKVDQHALVWRRRGRRVEEVAHEPSDQKRRNRHRRATLRRRHLLRRRNDHPDRSQSPAPADAEVIDATGKYVFPGFIDPHVHIYLPFMGTFAKDTYETGSQAALVGGTTTLIEMCCPAREENRSRLSSCGWAKREERAPATSRFHMGVTQFDDEAERDFAKS